MSNTRIGNDACRIIDKNMQITGPGRWVIDVPGPGETPPYMMDPHIRLEKWGANIWTDQVELENKRLRGNEQPLIRGCVDKKRKSSPLKSRPIQYEESTKLNTEQSRTICPPWTLRGLESNNWKEPNSIPTLLNPIAQGVSERLLAKKQWAESHNMNTRYPS